MLRSRMKSEDLKKELEKAQHASEIKKVNRQANFDAINDYISFTTEKCVAFGATIIGFSEYTFPEWISFLSLSPELSVLAAGTGLGLLGGPKVNQIIKRISAKG